MDTGSNLHRSLDAEDFIDTEIHYSTSAPSTNPTFSSAVRSSHSHPVVPVPATMVVQTPLEQKFPILKECTKESFIDWIPKFLSYQSQGGAKTLPYCLDPVVQSALMFLLPEFEHESENTFY